MFQHLFRMRPPTLNTSKDKRSRRKKDERENDMRSQLTHIMPPLFSEETELKATVYYFDYSNRSTRDVHNIFKGIFDALGQGFKKEKPPLVYHDDSQIVVFTGIRLDMNKNGNSFEESSFLLNLDNLDYDDYDYLTSNDAKDCFLVEVQNVRSHADSSVQVIWSEDFDSFDV